jgi:hypothetical protein
VCKSNSDSDSGYTTSSSTSSEMDSYSGDSDSYGDGSNAQNDKSISEGAMINPNFSCGMIVGVTICVSV